MSDSPRQETALTVPNAISSLRILGLLPLVWAAHTGHRTAFLIILLVLLSSDWIDGRLATLFDQRTVLGARLDSVADWLLYAALGVSVWWLEEAVVRERIVWFVVAIGTWVVSCIVSVARFGSLPSYHTWGAKTAWLVAGTVTVVWVMFKATAAVPWALGFVTLANLEAVAIGFVLPEWKADVSSLSRAVRLRRDASRHASRDATAG